MVNLYNGTIFCKQTVNHKNKLLVHGVIQKGMQEILKSVMQDEVISRQGQLLVKGTVKATMLERTSDCINLVASTLWDSKPVHYLSMVCKDIKWEEVEELPKILIWGQQTC